MLLEAAHRYDRPVGLGVSLAVSRKMPRAGAASLRIDQIELEIFGAQIRENVNGPLYYVGK